MPTKASEIYIRDQSKSVLNHLENGNLLKAQELILNHKEILSYNFGLVNFIPLLPRIRFSKTIPKNNEALKMVIKTGFEIYSKEDNFSELLFFAAAKCDLQTLKTCINKFLKTGSNINQVREGDTVVMFMIKFGNIADEQYPECMKILIDAGVDVMKNDYFSHSPVEFLTNLQKSYSNKSNKDELVVKNFQKCLDLLRKNHSTTENYRVDELFKFLIDGDEDSFINTPEIKQFLDADDGSKTFLQLCCEKNLKKAAKFLTDSGADLNKTTSRTLECPLELAARRNNFEIFSNLLNTNKIQIDQELFKKFLRGRPRHIKPIFFDEILKSKCLDLNVRSNNGNTPLHYAIIFSSSEAILTLLRRGASLLVKNDSGKTALDYISGEDFEIFLNKCIIRDCYNDINNGKYELSLNFQNLIQVEDSNVISELSVIEQISTSPKLCNRLNHALLSSFFDIKWQLSKPIYQKLFVFYISFYCISILSFINLHLLNYLAIPLTLIYVTKIWSTFNWNSDKLHHIVDIIIATIVFLSFYITNENIRYQFGIIATLFMALSFHLFWRFSPDFSQIHARLINVLTQFISYLFYISGLIFFVGAAFYIFFLIHNENDLSTQYQISLYFYLLCVFGVFVGVIIFMTVINSITYLQQNSENLKHNFQTLSYKNTLVFLHSVEKFFNTFGFIKNPFIFDKTFFKENEDVQYELNKKKVRKTKKSKNKYLVNFCINTNKFVFEKLHDVKLTETNVLKIRNVISR